MDIIMNTGHNNIKVIYFGSLLFCLLEILLYRASNGATREADFLFFAESIVFILALILHVACLVLLIIDIFRKKN